MTISIKPLLAATAPSELALILGYELEPWQREVTDEFHERTLVVAARRAGKSLAATILALWTALHRPGATVVIISPSARQSDLVYSAVVELYERLGGEVGPPVRRQTRTLLHLGNNARVVALPGDSPSGIRGWGADLLIIDECAFTSDALFAAAVPMLSEGAPLLAITTPGTRSGWAYEAWTGDDDSWRKIHVRADQSAQYSEARIASRRAAMPAWQVQRELMASFTGGGGGLFDDQEMLDAALCADLQWMRPDWRQWG